MQFTSPLVHAMHLCLQVPSLNGFVFESYKNQWIFKFSMIQILHCIPKKEKKKKTLIKLI